MAEEAARRKKSGAGGDTPGAGGITAAEQKSADRWYKLEEARRLSLMSITQKTAWYEEEITALRKAQASDTTNKDIASDILELEKKILDLKKEQAGLDTKKAKELASIKDSRGKAIEDYDQGKAAAKAGKGIGTPDMARIDSLQQIGGLVGGVAGAGSQKSRMAERQAKITESIEKLTRDMLSKTRELDAHVVALGGE